MAGTIILAVGYGIEAKEKDDPYLWIVQRAVKALSLAAVPGAFLVDTFPILKYIPEWMPGASFQTKGRLWKSYTMEMLEKPFEATKKMMVTFVLRGVRDA